MCYMIMQLCYRSRGSESVACRSTQRKHGLQRTRQARGLQIDATQTASAATRTVHRKRYHIYQTISAFHSHDNRYQFYLFTLMLSLQVLNQTPPEFDAFRGSHLHDEISWLMRSDQVTTLSLIMTSA
jgi:hypothetical protein